MHIWHWLGWLLVAWSIYRLAPMWWRMLRPRLITHIPPAPADDPSLPMVSIIVPARDEAAKVGECLQTLLTLDYPRYEIIAVDDRSTDTTGEIMDRAAAADPRCRVIHVHELPAGWLGKNHANHLAAREARGDLLLFTDGDVIFQPSVLSRAVALMREQSLDHLVLLPGNPPGGFWEQMLMAYFIFMFSLHTRLALVRFKWAKNAYVGVGAFNLVTRRAYESIGGHQPLRMEVADDLMLGKLIKDAGFTQEAYIGDPLVSVKWQTGVRGIIRGLEKNAFAGMRYSAARTVASIFALWLTTLPFIFAFTGPARLPFGLVSALSIGSFLVVALRAHYNPLIALFFPLGGPMLSFIILRSAWITLRRGGVTWRDTFYPLEELRRGMV